MPIVMLLAAATGLTVPSLSISPDDYPAWAVKKSVSGGGIVHTIIDPAGKVIQCSVVSEIGDPKLAGSVCSVIARKRFQPGTLGDGQKVHSILISMVNFWLPDTAEGRKIGAMRQGPDAEITVNQMPIATQTEATVLLAYDASGKTTDCAPAAKASELTKLACDQRTIFDDVVQMDSSGRAIPYVTRKIVRFQPSSSKK